MLLLIEQVHNLTGMIIVSKSPPYSMIPLMIFFISDKMIKVLLGDKSVLSFFFAVNIFTCHSIAFPNKNIVVPTMTNILPCDAIKSSVAARVGFIACDN